MSTGEGRFLMALEKAKDKRSIESQLRKNKKASDKKQLWSLLGKIGMFTGNPLIAGLSYLGGEFIPDALGVKEKKLKVNYFGEDEIKDYNAELSKQRKQRALSTGIGLAANVFGASVMPEGDTLQSMLKKTGSKLGIGTSKAGVQTAIKPLTMKNYLGTENPYGWDVKGLNMSDKLREAGFNIPNQSISNFWR